MPLKYIGDESAGNFVLKQSIIVSADGFGDVIKVGKNITRVIVQTADGTPAFVGTSIALLSSTFDIDPDDLTLDDEWHTEATDIQTSNSYAIEASRFITVHAAWDSGQKRITFQGIQR